MSNKYGDRELEHLLKETGRAFRSRSEAIVNTDLQLHRDTVVAQAVLHASKGQQTLSQSLTEWLQGVVAQRLRPAFAVSVAVAITLLVIGSNHEPAGPVVDIGSVARLSAEPEDLPLDDESILEASEVLLGVDQLSAKTEQLPEQLGESLEYFALALEESDFSDESFDKEVEEYFGNA